MEMSIDVARFTRERYSFAHSRKRLRNGRDEIQISSSRINRASVLDTNANYRRGLACAVAALALRLLKISQALQIMPERANQPPRQGA